MKPELIFPIGISLIPGVGAVMAKKLIAYCGGAEAVFKEKPQYLKRIPGVGPVLSKAIHSQKVLHRAEQELHYIEKHKIEPTYFLEKEYPYRLLQCEDGPILLYHKGRIDWNKKHFLSVVGSRSCSDYGKQFCAQLMQELKPYDPVIVSGLAYGVDACAHKEAMQNGLSTIAVLAHGLDMLYPQQHRRMAEKMMQHGGLLTDFISGTELARENFVKRNRIIAGLSEATLVIESGLKGGSLITADLANSYNREVLALAGRVDSAYAQGCHQLIKTHKAALMTSGQDVVQLLGWEKQEREQEEEQEGTTSYERLSLNPDELAVLKLLSKLEARSLEYLQQELLISSGNLARLLLQLEFKKLLRPLPGRRYLLV